jgi:hypothetical protein
MTQFTLINRAGEMLYSASDDRLGNFLTVCGYDEADVATVSIFGSAVIVELRGGL